MAKRTIEIRFTQQMTFHKIVEVEDELADRLLELDGEDIMQGSEVTWEDGYSNDNFTLIAEDLTDINDVQDSEKEITDVQITEL